MTPMWPLLPTLMWPRDADAADADADADAADADDVTAASSHPANARAFVKRVRNSGEYGDDSARVWQTRALLRPRPCDRVPSSRVPPK
ncbi:hypothetical protein [Rhodococcus sp. IEGM 1341]|uniref:hypothetical protein n=1 Tax=Rhodococcus sp. IEGM 1341 TaxID=3047090 RepID=UPI0024B67C77|nr:hypothetical protein [Rhodococcus sp. IEGM 1341]MDI9928116.1 hypothetical protein [Rhodococcus sp. IEGM 1341]